MYAWSNPSFIPQPSHLHRSWPVYSPLKKPYPDSLNYALHISHSFPLFWTHASWKSLSSNICGLSSLIALKARFPITSTLSLCLKPPSPFPHNHAPLILVFSSPTNSGEHDYKLRRNTAYPIKLTQRYQLPFSRSTLIQTSPCSNSPCAHSPKHFIFDSTSESKLPKSSIVEKLVEKQEHVARSLSN